MVYPFIKNLEGLLNRVLFIFRRDLRLEDNKGLLFALENAKEVILAFIFTPEQMDHNPYRNDHCLQFMLESLEDLENEIKLKGGKLYLFYGAPEAIVAKCIQNLNIEGVFVNRDYTPYSKQRDHRIEETCKKNGVRFLSFEDALLCPIENLLNNKKEPYKIFTPYFRQASKLDVEAPLENSYTHYYSKKIPFAEKETFLQTILPKRKELQKGGRKAALGILQSLSKYFFYEQIRDFPHKEEGTTHLGPHLKFTTCSPREFYHAIRNQLGVNNELIRSLYWRDFFTSIAYWFPYVFEGPFRSKFQHIAWSQDKNVFKKWCEGSTGVPIVDAGMRQMNQTGFMHNRVRMIAGSFLVKDLHMDWRWGEKYFAQTLIDYDPCVNNGNWQWVAGTGCDSQPYFRIFNPWAQAKKFDPECLYIKKWIPELKNFSSSYIHSWNCVQSENGPLSYPKPCVDHAVEARKSLLEYKKWT